MVGCVVPLLMSGCAPLVKELKKPPFPYTATHHSRVVGIKLSYQGYGFQLGFCSETLTLIPCSTNALYAAPISDRFRVGQSGLDSTITEEINTGWKDQPPAPMIRLFSPKAKDQPRQPSAHAESFARKQAVAPRERPRSAMIGALDSFAPVFALQFSDTERRPIAVLELNADDAFNSYKIIGSISYTDTNSPPIPPALPK